MSNWYRDTVFVRIMNKAMDTKETRRIRQEACEPLAGEVLEIGFGTGLNLPHIPAAVTKLLVVDPMERGRELAAERIAASAVPLEFVGLRGESLPIDDSSIDAVLATWTLCSIDDPVAAVREIRRVLRPNGAFHFVEHGQAPDAKVRRWQDRFNPIQQRVACGCNLNRDIPALIAGGGMEIANLKTFYAKGDPKIMGWMYQGVATRAMSPSA